MTRERPSGPSLHVEYTPPPAGNQCGTCRHVVSTRFDAHVTQWEREEYIELY